MKKININRRNFLKRFLYALLSIQLFYVLYRLLKPRNKGVNLADYYDAGEIAIFEKGKIYPFGSRQFYLYRFPDGGFMAVSSKCTHLGCTIQFKANHGRFECPCHASAFDTNGEVLSPPATRALDYFPIAFKDNRVLVDTNHPLKRSNYDASQIKYL